MGDVELRTKIVVGAGALVIIAALSALQFCRGVSVAAKPGKPREKSSTQVIAESKANVDAYLQGVARDASLAALRAPTIEDMSRALVFHRDDQRRTLVPGGAPIRLGDLTISAKSYQPPNSEKLLVLDIQNTGAVPLAYEVDTQISGGDSACLGRTMIDHNAVVVGPGKTERRSECALGRGMEVYVNRVETAELTPFFAYYLSRVQPQALGTRDRIAHGHKPQLPGGVALCGAAMDAIVRSGLEDGSVQWGDLVDFYARHSCDTYQFYQGYKAFTKDGERPLPDGGE